MVSDADIQADQLQRAAVEPSLAIVIPVYNGREHLAETLQSCLNQVCPAAEIIVVEDGSPQPSHDIVKALRGVRYIFQPNSGVSGARNHGVSLATADWICFLDQDDILLPGHIEQFVQATRAGIHADLFYTSRLILTCVNGTWTTTPSAPPPSPGQMAQVLPLRCPFPPSGVCVRRSVFERMGGFHSRYDLAEDWEFWLRLSMAGGIFHHCPGFTVCYRVHMRSNSHRPIPILKANLRVIREQILPPLSLWKRLWTERRLISAQEADAAILMRQMGHAGSARLLLRSILRFPCGAWRRYKIAAYMLITSLTTR